MRNARSIAVGAIVGSISADGDERPDDGVEVDQPEADRHRDHQLEHTPDRRVAVVDDDPQPAVPAAQPRQRQQHLDDRAEHDRRRVDVELAVRRVRARDAEHEAEDDHDVPRDRRQRRDRELPRSC